MFTKLADILTIDQFAISYGFSQSTFVEPPDLSGIAESYKTVKRGFDRYSVKEEFVTGNINIIIPNDTISTDVYCNRVIELGMFS